MNVRTKQGVLLSMAALGWAVGVGAQTQRRPPTDAKPANTWMKTPMDPQTQDDVIPYVRYLRDQYWDDAYGQFGVLTPQTVVHSSQEDGGYRASDIPELQERQALFIGTFDHYVARLTPSGRVIYTDVAFTVQHLFRDASKGHASAGLTVTVSFPGGTVRKEGQIISFLTSPQVHFVQPGRTYLLMPIYYQDGDFYINGTPEWDLSDGRAKPNSALSESRVKQGDSKVVGLTKDELIRLLDQRFSR